jgi:AcrR family transcriptional regulator
VHRLLHGPIPDLNAGRFRKGTPRRTPAWPEFVATEEPKRARGRQTRKALLDAGRSVLPMRGYRGTRVDDVVAVAGVSHGSFYRYFANTDDLFHALAQDAAVHLVELVDGFPDEVDDAALQAWLDQWMISYRDHGGVITAWQELDHDDPELARFSIEIAIVVLDRLTRIVQRRGFGDAAVDALVLLSVIERMPYNVLVLGHLDQTEAIDASVFLLRRGLFGL